MQSGVPVGDSDFFEGDQANEKSKTNIIPFVLIFLRPFFVKQGVYRREFLAESLFACLTGVLLVWHSRGWRDPHCPPPEAASAKS